MISTLHNLNFRGGQLFLIDALVRTSFKIFLRKVFDTICPGQQFQDNWHINYIIDELFKVENKVTKRLAINLPPRSLKSIIMSVAWPAWLLGYNPKMKIVVASYSKDLANKHSQDCRTVMNSPWYKRVFREAILRKGENKKSKFMTTEEGFRFATSIKSTLTGEGADLIIIDDPLTPLQASSTMDRERVNSWFDSTLSSRLNDKNNGAMVLTMQRLHPNDLTGHLLSKGNWRHIALPVLATHDEKICFGSTTILRTAGDALHPQRENRALINQAKLELGAAAFNAQYQQNPVSSVYSIIKPVWAKKYAKAPNFDQSLIYQSWDCAAKTHEMNDYSVCTTWLVNNESIYLLDVVRDRYDYPDLRAAAIAQYQKFKPQAVLIEDKITGHALIGDLLKEAKIPVIKVTPKLDKLTRVTAISSLFEAGMIHLPLHSHFLAEYENELFNFPNSQFDDQVDSTSQFLNWFNEKRCIATPRIRRF